MYRSDYADRIQAIVNPSAVDLGLSVKWASFNLGATKPEDYGDYYAWGETEPKENYSWSTYKFGTSSSGPFSKYNTISSYGSIDNKTVLEPEDDVAHVKLGGKWRMPTDAEWAELRTKCTWTWVTNYNGSGINGGLVKATNGNSIFLPAAGYRDATNLYNAGSGGRYWSSSLSPDYPSGAFIVVFGSDGVGEGIGERACGVVDIEYDVGLDRGGDGAFYAQILERVVGRVQAGCVDEAEGEAVDGEGLLDGVACGAGDGTHDGAVVGQQGVEQG